MKHKIALFLAFFSLSCSFAQAPIIEWQKCYGGTSGDGAQQILLTADGGYVIAGYSYSSNGDATINQGNSDCWVIKTNAAGTIEWEKSFGGTDNDSVLSIQLTTDGGYIVSGQTYSNNGDVTGNQGFFDYWVVKLSATGTIQWQKTYGGGSSDASYAIQNTSDGGYIIGGYAASNNGNITGNHGQTDYWVVKINATGTIQWQKSLGGSDADIAYDLQKTPDGGYILVGQTFSTNGDVTGHHGGSDCWITKLSSTGILQWQKTLGGSGNDYGYSIQNTPDGGYVVGARTTSNDGDVTGNQGGSDYWIVKLNASGVIQWQKTYGGSGDDSAFFISLTPDGGYVMAGQSNSTDGDVTGNHGLTDYWIVKLNNLGDLQWQKSIGGTGEDRANFIQVTPDGGYVIAGRTSSNDGDASGNHGGTADVWVVKLTQEGLAAPAFEKQSVFIYPNPVRDKFQIQTPLDANITKIRISDLSGKVVVEQNQNSTTVSIENLAKGMYMLEAYSDKDTYVCKFIKE